MLLALKSNLWETEFSSVQTKTNPIFAVKLAERSNHLFLLSVWWITFFKHLYSCIIMECIELNWLFKHMKKIRSRQAAIPYAELNKTLVKHSFFSWVSFWGPHFVLVIYLWDIQIHLVEYHFQFHRSMQRRLVN